MKLFKTTIDSSFWEKLEFYRFSIMMFTITVSTAIGSIAVYYLFEQHQNSFFYPLALVVSLAMASNTAAIAQSPIKWVILLFLVSTFLSILMIFFALLF
ncbi:MAG: hypothetical protein ACON4E_06250 [Flavobacteriales bacterium]